MFFDISVTTFKNLAAEIADLYNFLEKTKDYQISSVEINCLLTDNGDGKGYQVESRALIRLPDKNEYGYWVSIIGTPFEALNELKASLLKRLQESSPEEHKKKILSLN